MENKLGSYINNLMTTIVDREEKWFNRGLAYNELTSLKNNINEVLINYDELGMIPKSEDKKDKDQLEFDFDKKQYDKLNNSGEEEWK